MTLSKPTPAAPQAVCPRLTAWLNARGTARGERPAPLSLGPKEERARTSANARPNTNLLVDADVAVPRHKRGMRAFRVRGLSWAVRALGLAVVLSGQRSLLGGGPPALEGLGAGLAGLQRRWLDETAWVDYHPSWVSGHEALMESLFATSRWQQPQREMYERTVDVPRLVAGLPDDGPGHPLLEAMRTALAAHYATAFPRTGLAYYRHGQDSVAWHGDYVARELPEAIVATVSLGEPRRFLLRPKGGGPSLAYRLGWGDLIVMGGSCQRTWQHAIPKVARAHPRLVIMFRPIWPAPPGAFLPPGY